MIRVIQRRLIIPRGDTGIFTIPAMTQAEGAIGVFTIFDPITNTRIFQKQVEIEGENFNISFSHADTVNLKAGDYLWDIKFYKNPILADNKVIDGEEINSYYAAFQAPKCEIRETGDDFLMIEGQPAKIEDLNIILGATEAANAAKAAATEQAGIAATKAEEAAAKLEQMMAAIPTKVSELENDSGYLQEETDPTVPAWAKAAEKPTYTPQEVGALPADTFIPSKVSDLTDDSGHYTKPANGIPASDLEETYLTEHQDLSNYVQKTDYATTNNAGIVKIGAGLSIDGSFLTLYKASNNQIKQGTASYSPIVPAIQERSTFYGLAKAAGDTTQSQSANAVGTYTDEAKAAIQQMLDVPSTSAIPTNVSDLTNDAGYLTEHQDISGKANVADLAAVATSGSYNDLEDKPTIPDVRIDGTSIVENGVANIPIAQNNTLGVIKTIPTILNCATVDSLGNLYVNAANGAQIKAASSKNNPIVPGSMHMATFYGLSKAAGADLANEENITVGTYPASAKTAIQTMLDVPSNAAMTTAIGNAIGNINSFDMAVVQELPAQDISTHTIYLVPKTGETNDVYDEYVYINNAWEMVGNTQVDLSNYVQKTDYASTSAAGVIKLVANGGLIQRTLGSSSYLIIDSATEENNKNGTLAQKPISPNTLDSAAFYGLARAAGDATQSQSDNTIGTYTNEAKAAIQQMLDVPSNSDIPIESGTAAGSVKTKDFIVNKQTFSNTANGIGAFAEGLATIASGITSHAEGQNTTASNTSSHAEGIGSEASGNSAHAEGSDTIASGFSSHTEGFHTQASGRFSHAEGNNTVAQGEGEHVSGGFNTISATIYSVWEAGKEYNVGDIVIYSSILYRCKVANAENTFKYSYWAEYPLGSTLYSCIVGNGIADDARSNAYALTWTGDGHYAGDVYVHSNTDSSGGERLAKESELGLKVVRLI